MPGRLSLHRSDQPVRNELLLEGHSYLIGRDPSCDIRIDDPELSRQHARLRWQEARPVLEDLGSKNGLIVEGRRIERIELADDTWIGLGRVLARFELLSQSALSAETAAVRRRQETSLALQRALDPTTELSALLRQTLDSVLAIAGTQRGFVLLASDDGDLDIAASSRIAEHELVRGEFAGSVGAVNLVLEQGTAVVSCDALADTRIAGRPSIVAGGIRALVCLPLRALDRNVGAVYSDSLEPGKVFTELDVGILSELVEHAALVIAAARLREELAGIGEQLPASKDEATGAGFLRRWRERITSIEHVPRGAVHARSGAWSSVLARHSGVAGAPR